MARMHPEDIEGYERATCGEKRVFRFLREAARPHKDFICWYEPPVGGSGQEPDFILFGEKVGLLVIEVKDWTSDQIISYNPHRFTILDSGKNQKRTNPDRQARGYVNALKERLSDIPEFLSNQPKYEGNLGIPIGRVVAFPNISREEYVDSKFKWFIESERCLLKDDLDPAGEILSDTSGRRFRERISKVFPFPFKGLTRKGLDIGTAGIEVCHFFELCSRILGEPVHYENEEAEYYDLVIQETLEKVLNRQSRVAHFDAVLVDEGQDFDGEMMKILLNLLTPEGDLVISLDSCQDLYRRKASWKSIGIRAGGRTRYLKNVYRNTVEIFNFTQCFLGESPKGDRQLALLPDDLAFHADDPVLCRFASLEEMERFLVEDLKRCVAEEGYRRSEIAVIYDDKVYGPSRFAYDNRALPMRLLGKMETSGIPAAWVSQDVRSKEMYDITTDRVSLISVHSSKGLDFDLVYLVAIDHIRPTEAMKETLLSLVYVAMTRAKYRLVIPYVEETEFISRMKRCIAKSS
jgi:hypothetical protein